MSDGLDPNNSCLYASDGVVIHCGDAEEVLRAEVPAESIHTCVTSPPYWGLRDYGTATWEGGDDGCDHAGAVARTHNISGRKEENKPREIYRSICGKCGARRIDSQLGLEATPEEYVAKMVEVFAEVRRVLRDDGTLWLNMGDSYARDNKGIGGAEEKQDSNIGSRHRPPPQASGLKPKDLCGIPWRVAFALQADGWYLRQDIIWAKPNPMPESVTDRCTKSHEYLFLLAKNERYYFDAEAIKEPAASAGQMRGGSTKRYEQNEAGMDCKLYDDRNKRSVWTVGSEAFAGAHFATFPKKLIYPCIKAGCPEGGTVLDPFIGSGTTAEVARMLGCRCVGIELNPDYILKMCAPRLSQGTFFGASR